MVNVEVFVSEVPIYPGFGRHFVWLNVKVSTKFRLAFPEIRLAIFTVKDAMKKMLRQPIHGNDGWSTTPYTVLAVYL